MSTVRRIVITMALTLMIAVSVFSGAIFGGLVADIATEGKLYDYAWERNVTFSPKPQEELKSWLMDAVKEESYGAIKRMSEEENFQYNITSIFGTPIARSKDWYRTTPEGTYWTEYCGQNKEYKLQVVFLGKEEEIIDSRYELLFETWIELRSNKIICVSGAVFSLLLFVVSLGLLLVQASVAYKVFLGLVTLGLIECVGVWVLNLPNKQLMSSIVAGEKLLLYFVALFYIHKLHDIRKRVQSIGKTEQTVSEKEKRMPISLRDFSREVNEATDSINVAVNERMKSDRLKTELISNVSHDLKTPLTSIVNFSDLISKEPTENANITEYAEHLHRQSIRLKELMDALIEASKASSGAIEMEMIPCKVQTLLEQCIVEYEDKLAEKNITFVDLPFQEKLLISADVKALCRIFENLLNNICKYALPGSRAYIEVKKENDKVAIYFKNVSAEAINLNAEELTERFVRGDASRHSEGYGLGLSIVKSLMDLMNGGLELSAEYDMFVVKLIFPEYLEAEGYTEDT